MVHYMFIIWHLQFKVKSNVLHIYIIKYSICIIKFISCIYGSGRAHKRDVAIAQGIALIRIYYIFASITEMKLALIQDNYIYLTTKANCISYTNIMT